MAIKFDTELISNVLLAGWRRRFLVVAPFAVLPLISLVVGIMAPRVYETRMSILVQEIDNNPVVQDLAVQTNIKDRMEGLEVLLHSRHILLNVIDKLHMLPPNTSDVDRERLVQNLGMTLSARLIGKDLVELKMRSGQPAQMTDILIAAAESFIDAIRAPGQSSLENSEIFFRDKIKERQAALDTAEQALAVFRDAHSDALPELHAANIQRLAQLKDSLQEKKTDLAGAEAADQVLRSRLAQANPIVGKLEEQIVQVSGELAMLRARYTDEHSAVQGALHKLQRLEEERARQIGASQTLFKEGLDQMWNRAASMPAASPPTGTDKGDETLTDTQPLLVSQLTQLQSAEAKVSGLKREIVSLTQDVSDLQGKTTTYGEVERQMNNLDREVRTQQELYDSLLKRFETARLTVDLGQHALPDQIKVIDRPAAPAPVNMPLVVFFLAGCAGAGMLGVALAFVAELLDNSIRTVGQLERLVKAPVLSTIPVLFDEGFLPDGTLDITHGAAA